MNLKEPLTLAEIVAVSLHSNHWESLPHGSAIDRIGALGMGNRQGVLLRTGLQALPPRSQQALGHPRAGVAPVRRTLPSAGDPAVRGAAQAG